MKNGGGLLKLRLSISGRRTSNELSHEGKIVQFLFDIHFINYLREQRYEQTGSNDKTDSMLKLEFVSMTLFVVMFHHFHTRNRGSR